VELFKLRVQNLGRIKNAEIGIRPLTVFVGPANTNKTWTAYALYGLAKCLSWRSFPFAGGGARRIPNDMLRVPNDMVEVDDQLRRVTETVLTRLLSSLSAAPEDATILEEVTREEMLAQITGPLHISLLPEGFTRLLELSEPHPADMGVILEITRERFSLGVAERASFQLQKRLGGECTATVEGKEGVIRRRFYQSVAESDDKYRVRGLFQLATELLLFGNLCSVLAFPAERKALVTVYDLLKEEGDHLLIEPVADFVGLLKGAQASVGHRQGHNGLPRVLALLEEKLLAGKVYFDSESDPFSLTYDDGKGRTLEMHAASSLVRALAGLHVYLKHVAAPQDLIVIDEPEMNAHPEAQLMIAELLGVLVNKGINVVITTHSPYIVDHLNNLIEAAHLPEAKQDEIAPRFKLQTKEAFVPSEMISVYLFDENGRVSDLFDREERDIDWSTFGNTSDRMSNLFNEILETAKRE